MRVLKASAAGVGQHGRKYAERNATGGVAIGWELGLREMRTENV